MVPVTPPSSILFWVSSARDTCSNTLVLNSGACSATEGLLEMGKEPDRPGKRLLGAPLHHPAAVSRLAGEPRPGRKTQGLSLSVVEALLLRLRDLLPEAGQCSNGVCGAVKDGVKTRVLVSCLLAAYFSIFSLPRRHEDMFYSSKSSVSLQGHHLLSGACDLRGSEYSWGMSHLENIPKAWERTVIPSNTSKTVQLSIWRKA